VSASGASERASKLFAAPCVFVAGASDPDVLPPGSLPELAFVGRSNCGKSSLLNALVNRRGLARVSNTPGRTREINFFRLGTSLMLADLPGYGYARASKALAASWHHLVFSYLGRRSSLRRVFVLIDARRGVLPIDREVMNLLGEAAVSFALVLTKIDKLARSEVPEALRAAEAETNARKAGFPKVVATSATKRLGLEELREQIAELGSP